MAIQPLKDQLIEQLPGTLLGFWALDDIAGVSTPALTYPETQSSQVSVVQSGAPAYQQAEPFAGAGTMVGLPSLNDKLTLTMPVGAMATFLMKMPDYVTDPAAWKDYNKNPPTFLGKVFNEGSGGLYIGQGNIRPPVLTGYFPVTLLRDSASSFSVSVYGSTLFSVAGSTYTLLNLKGASISNLSVIEGVGVTTKQVNAVYIKATDLHQRTGSPRHTALAALYAPNLLLGGDQISMPDTAATFRLGRHHVDTSPISILPDANCTKAEVIISDATPPTTVQPIQVEVNVSTLFTLTVTPASGAITVNGVSGTATTFAPLTLTFEIITGNKVAVTVTEGAANTLVLTTSLPLADPATKLTRLDVDSGEFRVDGARSEGLYPTLTLPEAESYGYIKIPNILLGELGGVSSGRSDTNLTHFQSFLDGWSGGQYTSANYITGVHATIGTGPFTVSSEGLNLATLAETNNPPLNYVIPGKASSAVTLKGDILFALGANTPGSPYLIVTVSVDGKVYLYTNTQETEVQGSTGIPMSVILRRDASSKLELFVDGQVMHTVASFTDDLQMDNTTSVLVSASLSAVSNPQRLLGAYNRSLALFDRSLTDTEVSELAGVVKGVPPSSVYKRVYGEFKGVSDGAMWLLRADSGEVLATTPVTSESRFTFDNFGYIGEFIVIGASADNTKVTSELAKLTGVDVLPAPSPTIPDGTNGTHKVSGGAFLAGVKHKATIYVYRVDTMELLAKRFVFGGLYEVKFSYAGDVRVVERVDTTTYHTVKTPS